MEGYDLIVLLIYIGLTIYIIPKSGVQFDLYRIRFRLLPHWFKFLAIIWILISVVGAFIISGKEEKWVEYLNSSIDLALYVLIFSKQKEEDEFSEFIRFRSVTYSFVSLIAIIGAFGAIDIKNEIDILNTLNLHLLMGVTLLTSLLYFYITLYRFKKSN